MGSNPVQAWIFSRLSFRNCLSCIVTARIFLSHSFVIQYLLYQLLIQAQGYDNEYKNPAILNNNLKNSLQYRLKLFDHLPRFCIGWITVLICSFTSSKPCLTPTKALVFRQVFFQLTYTAVKGRTRLGLNWLLFALFSSSSTNDKQTAGLRCDKFHVQIFGTSLHWKLLLFRFMSKVILSCSDLSEFLHATCSSIEKCPIFCAWKICGYFQCKLEKDSVNLRQEDVM